MNHVHAALHAAFIIVRACNEGEVKRTFFIAIHDSDSFNIAMIVMIMTADDAVGFQTKILQTGNLSVKIGIDYD